MTIAIHGTLLSPWVRRLLAFCEEKGVEYDIVNVVPLGEPDPEFLKISPLGKVPVLEVDGRYLPDSLAACSYLESKIDSPVLFPSDGWERGWMLWLCDYLGTGLFSKVEAPLFIQRFINPAFLNMETDDAVVAEALAQMPAHFDYLESQLSEGKEFLVGDALSLADLTAGSIFVNFCHAGEIVNADRWPALAAFVQRVHARPSFVRILEREKEAVGAVSPMFA
ncbi:glutathione S-transferase family protein [Parasphingopyxis sp. CP4]|uniref:glutathione S-transferase family protein n=1 Tax=Parasphingopyxis sp. CP4 TaxID=2724527 RepID=UPI0015A49161|nr:glutathione S-transferase family protein [Parasphingopyxis sp. CP4]QLC22412.1 glutathione S-transferase family protein [Parasphingopyxis sp. CP4]